MEKQLSTVSTVESLDDYQAPVTVGTVVKFQRIRRITGYLVGTTDRWNDAKRKELADRVQHGDSYGSV
ncbi:MAG: hypothetical protein LBS77_01200 [Desulfovibrio sp.]|nr:hypothetical protein [Desulfovibrio sp.]